MSCGEQADSSRGAGAGHGGSRSRSLACPVNEGMSPRKGGLVTWFHRGVATLATTVLWYPAPLTVAEGRSKAPATSGASVLEWNARAAQLIVGPGGAAKAPALGLVDLAIVHTAIYDAVNAVERFPFSSYAVVPDVPGPASGDAAVAAAGRGTLIALFPDPQRRHRGLVRGFAGGGAGRRREDERHLGRRADGRRNPRPPSGRRTQRRHPDRGAARGHGRLGPHSSRFRGAPGALGPIHHALEHEPTRRSSGPGHRPGSGPGPTGRTTTRSGTSAEP